MTLNCKPGDLAIVVHMSLEIDTWVIGRIVRCKTLGIHRGLDYWKLEDVLYAPDISYGCCTNIADRCLRPIRDPGDDAVDETLLWLPVPETEAA